MGIITNKPMRFTDKLVPKLGFAVPPATVVSGDTCGEPKPSIKPMLHACGKIHADPQHTLYVGDAERDICRTQRRYENRPRRMGLYFR